MIKASLRYLFTLIAFAVIGFILIVLVYLLPQSVIEENLRDGVKHMSEMGSYPQVVQGYKGTQLDYYTDYIKLAITYYDGDENILIKAAQNPRIGNSFGETERVEYGWYWHGYTVLLKPIFSVMTYWDFKILNTICSVGAVAITIYLLMRSGRRDFVIPYLLAVLLINPVVIALSFQYSPCYYLMHAILWYLINASEKKDFDVPYIFFIAGMLVTYFDLLTYPLVVYGVPVAFATQVMLSQGKKILHVTKKIVISGVTFVLGYGLMFAAKFIIGWIVTGGDVINTAADHILLRFSGNGLDNDIKRTDAIIRNLQVYAHLPYYILLAPVLVIIAVKCYKRFKQYGKCEILGLVPVVLIFIMPFVWYFVLANHSHIHYFFTSRALAVSAAALGMLATSEVHQDS